MTDIYSFVEARIDEEEHRLGEDSCIFDALRAVLDLHKNWPVLVTEEPKFEPPNFSDDFSPVSSHYTMQMTQKMRWLEGQEYVKVFGGDPPTTPMLRRIASMWSEHEDFNPSWELTREEYDKALGQQHL